MIVSVSRPAPCPSELRARTEVYPSVVFRQRQSGIGVAATSSSLSFLHPPVVDHEVLGPLGLNNGLARQELRHDRLDVEDRRSINGIEFSHQQRATLDR